MIKAEVSLNLEESLKSFYDLGDSFCNFVKKREVIEKSIYE